MFPINIFCLCHCQAALGENPTAADYATISVILDREKVALGTLSSRQRMFQFDLVFERKYVFYNSSRKNSVYLSGSMVFQPDEGAEVCGRFVLFCLSFILELVSNVNVSWQVFIFIFLMT
jgi:hypothetical protein